MSVFLLATWLSWVRRIIMMYACISVCLIVTQSALLTTQLDACFMCSLPGKCCIDTLPVGARDPFLFPGLVLTRVPSLNGKIMHMHLGSRD